MSPNRYHYRTLQAARRPLLVGSAPTSRKERVTMTHLIDPHTYWVCVDCTLAHHGYDEQELGYAFEIEPWSSLEEGLVPLPGLLYDEHACWEPMVDEQEIREYLAGEQSYRSVRETEEGVEFMPDECECEEIHFAHGTCLGCGSTLAGTRHAFTVFTWVA